MCSVSNDIKYLRSFRMKTCHAVTKAPGRPIKLSQSHRHVQSIGVEKKSSSIRMHFYVCFCFVLFVLSTFICRGGSDYNRHSHRDAI